MNHTLRITRGAERDLEEIASWIAEHDSPAAASYVLDRLLQTAQSVAALPQRGSRPKELPLEIGLEVHQVFFKPYRVIYEILHDQVIVQLIADGRRSFQSLLLRRLTES
ncbi:MAG: type II toxin-antitoxin system RelE/ParE family toxin [Terracidiphilus sp.]|jgi:toxin ParE1/3/4